MENQMRTFLHFSLFILFPICLLFSAVGYSAQPTEEAVPSFSDITGFGFGERITQHFEMVRYLEALAVVSPRVSLITQGTSWEGRELLLAIVTSAENHERLEEIQRNAQRLGDPRQLPQGESEGVIANQPVIVWLGGSIHGFELSGTEGVLKLLEHLTLNDDDQTAEVLRNAVVLIDPILNPDGRDAHAYFNMQRGGREPNPERFDWSNDTNWWEGLKFRTGHYFFDTNRDWFAHTQRETRNRVEVIQQWRPQVGVDAHEMGPDVEFYFDPPTDPVSPFFPEYATKWFEVFGSGHADAFDERGFEYTKREMFNYFYPAYTTSYLSYQGAVGMLYEQGSTRGLALKRSDGTIRTLADALEQQYIASLALVRTAAAHRQEMLRDYYNAHRAAIDDGQRGIRRYIISGEGDPYLTSELVNALLRNGIEVYRLNEDVQFNSVLDRRGDSIGRHTIRTGSFVVEAAQPRNRLIRALLEPKVPLPEEFLREARERVERGENPRFYDITAYSLPLLFNLNAYSTADGRSVNAERVPEEIIPAASVPDYEAGYAYLIDGKQTKSVSALYHMRDRGYRVAMMTEPTRIQGIDFARGTVVVRVNQPSEGVHTAVREVAGRFGLQVHAIETGRAERGFTAPGSPTTIDFRKPEIALVAEYPVFGYSFGWLWYTLDRQYEIPHTILRTGALRNLPLDRFDVIVLPSLSGSMLAREIGDEGVQRLKQWVRDGGTLVAITGGAVDFVREQLELTSLESWYDAEENKKKQRFSVPGAIFNTHINTDTWLSAGLPDELPVLVNSANIYLPSEDPPSPARRVVVTYADENMLAAGHAWDESLERMPGAVFAYEERAGSGRVIVFAEDVNFRAYLRGPNRLLLNAIVVGPSAP
jgi:hypothetical protein